MNYNEPTAARRRIPIYLVDSAGSAVSGLELTGAEVQLSSSGSAFVNGAGTITEVGSGTYYYEATQVETITDSYLILKIVEGASAALPFVFAVDIGERVSVEASETQRHVPIYLVDSTGTPVTGLALTGAEVQLSINGAAFVDATGTVTEIGSGAYDYLLTAAEITAEGFVVLKVIDAAAEPYVYSIDIIPAEEVTVTTGDSGFFGDYFGGGSAVSVVVEADPEPIEATVTATSAAYEDHIANALSRLPEYAKAKAT